MPDSEILQQQLLKSPEEIRSYILAGEWKNVTSQISEREHFSSVQKTKLENEILLILLAMDLQTNFSKNLVLSLGIPEDLSSRIKNELDKSVFENFSNFLPTELEPFELEAPHDMLIPANLPTKTVLEQKLGPLTKNSDTTPADPKWEERKRALGESSVVADYKGSDPYREPLT